MNIQYGTQIIEFTVDYRNRKTFEIGIEPPNIITVIAPKNVTEEKIKDVIRSKAKWITQKLYYFKEMEYRKRIKEYINGESFIYLGRNYSLQIVDDPNIKKVAAKLYQGKFYVYSNTREEDKIKAAMEEWYRKKTLDKIMDRINYYQKYFSVNPSSTKVKEQKKRWASCNSKRDLMFNWRCVMAPAWVLDYIVVHEMCHMVHMNHSKDFWDLVERIMPDYERRKEWLKNYGIRMDL